jgi:hypothetical protein
VVTALVQGRVTRKQFELSQKGQLEQLKETHRHNLDMLVQQQKQQEQFRLKQFAEADQADRLRIIEYIDLLVPRLCEIATLGYLGSDNKNHQELQRYRMLQKFSQALELHPAHPEHTLGLRIAFLLFQAAATRLAMTARWKRPLTPEQETFLAPWDSRIEPVICSGRYPGLELLYREQIEIVTEDMLIHPATTDLTRPKNWKEFCEQYRSDPALRELADLVSGKVAVVFNEDKALPVRRSMQCRLAIMALYFIQMSRLAGFDTWNTREEGLWDVVVEWFRWEDEQGQKPKWYLFEPGDVRQRLTGRPAGQRTS